jgi:hypothetical protein
LKTYNWIEEWSVEESKQFLLEVSQFISTLGGPLTKELTALVQADDYVGLANYQFDYSRQVDTRDLFLARQVHALFQKQEWRDIGLNPRKRAEDKFWEMESRCLEYNRKIDHGQFETGVWPAIERARQKIRAILGPVPCLKQLKISFGPGATTNVKGRVASPRAKLNASLACSRDMLPVVGDLLAEVPLWAWHHSGLPVGGWERLERSDKDLLVYPSVEVHPGKLSFVPKDARTMRPIVVEPLLNGFVQRAIGSYLKDRMAYHAALDLTDQTRNQRLARLGSIDGSFATIDLSSASDTVSWSVVRLLLPEDWFDFLASYRTGDIRAPAGVGCGGTVELEKFSSMGNGYTFELESLLFFSLALAVTELEDPPAIDITIPQIPGGYCVSGVHSFYVSVFGDDIICRTEVYPRLAKVLEELGFLVNHEKSFSQGPFRESCGADWFKGESIRPFYGKKPWSERVLYTFHNFAVRNCEPELAAFLFAKTNPSMRLVGPDGYGDGHLVASYNLRTNRSLRRAGWEGGFFDTYVLKPRRLKKRYASDWVHPSYSVYTRSSERDYLDPDIVRGSGGYAKVSLYTLAPGVFKPLGSASFEASNVVH